MYFKEYYPEAFFSRYIDSYFTIDTSFIYEDITDLVVPDGTFGLLFIDSQDSIKRNVPTQAPPITLKKSSLFGQKTKSVNYYYSPGKTQSFGIKINPEGLPLFLSDSSKDFKNLYVELDYVMDKGLMELEEKVLEKTNVGDKIQVVEQFLLQSISKINANPDYLLFVAIIEHIKEKKGEVRFDSLTSHFNLNYKKIERLFQHYLGVNPKTYIRIIRFNATIHLKNQLKELNLTQIGNEVGFFDQSHFIREFKTFSNLTPKEFFTKELSSSEKILMAMISKRWIE
ncbi:helix-turn-helix domain-containing protein [Muricauda sp. JGD-17]|uniref:Helix-turn-helix domain-containing protein n=1 Tax=Flagellimonas ochracea TaxID=2696472 RepID=A0A964TBT7_9FLAO|nr:helix-turn-helix domain-containing protein [Allomuricauda ochracea]NAY91281.1 helix-turn-helix domain-containing protein [Allomuricauda ochracea]